MCGVEWKSAGSEIELARRQKRNGKPSESFHVLQSGALVQCHRGFGVCLSMLALCIKSIKYQFHQLNLQPHLSNGQCHSHNHMICDSQIYETFLLYNIWNMSIIYRSDYIFIKLGGFQLNSSPSFLTKEASFYFRWERTGFKLPPSSASSLSNIC